MSCSSKRASAVLAFALCLCLPSLGAAQAVAAGAPAAPGPAALVEQKLAEVEADVKATENGASDAGPQKNDVTIVADKDKTNAKITFAWDAAKGKVTASASAPINKKDDATQLVTDSGPADDVKLGLGWKRQRYDLSKLDKVDLGDLAVRRLQMCSAAGVAAGVACSEWELEKALVESKESGAKIRKQLKEFWTVKVAGKDERVPLLRAIPMRYTSVDASVGETERKYFDLAGQENKEDRLSYSFSLTFGRVFANSRTTFSLAAGRTFKENTKVEQCSEVPDSMLETCKSLPLGKAAEKESGSAAVEYRWWGTKWAASPKLVFDVEESVAGVSVPIYLVGDKEGRFTGGIRFDWQENKDPVVSIFVSSPLAL